MLQKLPLLEANKPRVFFDLEGKFKAAPIIHPGPTTFPMPNIVSSKNMEMPFLLVMNVLPILSVVV